MKVQYEYDSHESTTKPILSEMKEVHTNEGMKAIFKSDI
jgi:hypothetical protein